MYTFKEFANIKKESNTNIGDLAQRIVEDETFPEVNKKRVLQQHVEENYSEYLQEAFASMWLSYVKNEKLMRMNAIGKTTTFTIPNDLLLKIERFKKENDMHFDVDAVVHLLEEGLRH